MSVVLLRRLSASVWMHLQPLLSCARPFIPFIWGEELCAALQGRTGNLTTKTWEAHFQFAACQYKRCVSLEMVVQSTAAWACTWIYCCSLWRYFRHQTICLSCTSKSEHQPRLFFYRKTVYWFTNNCWLYSPCDDETCTLHSPTCVYGETIPVYEKTVLQYDEMLKKAKESILKMLKVVMVALPLW